MAHLHKNFYRRFMNVKNGDIWLALNKGEENISPLLKLSEVRLPVKVSFELANLANKLGGYYTPIEQARNRLAMQHGEKDKSGNVTLNSNMKGYTSFMKELTELFSIEQDIEFKKVKLPLEVDGKPLNIEPKILAPLVLFIEVE